MHIQSLENDFEQNGLLKQKKRVDLTVQFEDFQFFYLFFFFWCGIDLNTHLKMWSLNTIDRLSFWTYQRKSEKPEGETNRNVLQTIYEFSSACGKTTCCFSNSIIDCISHAMFIVCVCVCDVNVIWLYHHFACTFLSILSVIKQIYTPIGSDAFDTTSLHSVHFCSSRSSYLRFDLL